MLMIKGESTINGICKRYEIAPSQATAWKKQLLDQGANVFEKAGKVAEAETRLEREQGKLYEKIGQLTVERDFLKKVWNKFQGSNDENQ
jgi:transposase